MEGGVMAQVHRVRRGPRAIVVRLPRDHWQGRTFTEADGTECDVIWNGDRRGPTLCGGIDRNADHSDIPARIHLPRPRA
jgi:hypothetical protein